MALDPALGILPGMTTRTQTTAGHFGRLLKQWRERRRLSQLGLAVDAEVSSRHLSFIETGRAQPSRDMVLLLSRVLEVPPRGRNDLLTAAGYAPVYRETGLEAPEMADVRRALDFMMRQQEPYPGLVIDGHWNILMTNGGALLTLIDSGSTTTVGNLALLEAARKNKAIIGETIDLQLRGVTGEKLPCTMAVLSSLRIGGLLIRWIPVVMGPIHTFDFWGLKNEPAILVGADILQKFRSVALDARRGEVRFSISDRAETPAI